MGIVRRAAGFLGVLVAVGMLLLLGGVVLNGTVDSEQVALLMLDHPGNPNFPTYWHARGYGLFAANPLGRKVFDEKQPEVTLTLEPGQSTTFRHRVVVLSETPSKDALEREYSAFAGTKGAQTQRMR